MPITLIEHREFGRRRALIHAFVINERGNRITCLVRNISTGGALLEVADPSLVSNHLVLRIDADGFEADCEVRHRTTHGIGIFFKDIRISKNGRDTRSAGPQLRAAMREKKITDLAPSSIIR